MNLFISRGKTDTFSKDCACRKNFQEIFKDNRHTYVNGSSPVGISMHSIVKPIFSVYSHRRTREYDDCENTDNIGRGKKRL